MYNPVDKKLHAHCSNWKALQFHIIYTIQPQYYRFLWESCESWRLILPPAASPSSRSFQRLISRLLPSGIEAESVEDLRLDARRLALNMMVIISIVVKLCVTNIAIQIRKYQSEYSYLPLFVNPNIFVFVFNFFHQPEFIQVLDMETKYIGMFWRVFEQVNKYLTKYHILHINA